MKCEVRSAKCEVRSGQGAGAAWQGKWIYDTSRSPLHHKVGFTMSPRYWLLGLLGILAGATAGTRVAGARDRDVAASEAPIVVELFTSEGCSSCPPADAFLKELSAISGVIVLSEHVDYWNRQGWTDPFSSASFTERQQLYAQRLGSEVYTPQMIVDGRAQFVGSDRDAAVAALRQATQTPKAAMSVSARVDGTHVAVHVDAKAGDATPDSDVVVALTEDDLSTAVTGGENKGRRIEHTGVTRVFSIAGRTKRGAASNGFDSTITLKSGWIADHMRVVTFLQSRKDGAIVGAASAPLAGQGHARLEGR